ncbi:hypothetical protein [Miltoncostaea marina]|uniref:hypothetical protein n=1 Tax=Miltoncostaea marina TaxID=2843215 RepID=UPI001C3CAF70|nr:hypothetical protein [Miltoncostaea marina]
MRRHALVALAPLAAAAALVAAGCGGDEAAELQPAITAQVAAAPVAVASVAPGGVVTPGPDTPAAVRRALRGRDVLVVSFVMAGPADDRAVAAALKEVRAEAGPRDGVRFFSYTLGGTRFGDLADVLGVTGTPSVAVIARDRTLANRWSGLVDAGILRQSIADARATAAAARGAAAR